MARPARGARAGAGEMVKQKLVSIVGWFVDWEPGQPFDWDARHCTYLLWWWRLGGWFVCPRKGHQWIPDHCGRPEHDTCYRCGRGR